ncbi:MAG TPA: hypothetical protein VFM79_03265, partial [Pelobium sp.]|nr:hypothetical protein [Pelobium sp.]
MLQKIGFSKVIEASGDLPVPGSNRGYNSTTIIESFIASIWCGANRFLHTEAGTNWIILDTGIEIFEQMHQSESWSKARRIVIVRQRIKDRPRATGKQLSLFIEEEIHMNYRYSAYVTPMRLAPAEIWRLYRGRGDAENRIKELK